MVSTLLHGGAIVQNDNTPPPRTQTPMSYHDQKAKDMLMRVGFEPTPFRTSDCSEPEGNTLS